MLVVRTCQACSLATRTPILPPTKRSFSSSRLILSDSIPPSSSSSPSPPPSQPSSPSTPKPSKPLDNSTLQVKLHEARHTAHLKLKTLLSQLDTSAKSQKRALGAAIEAWELERRLRKVGGKINEATGYEEIERLRIAVGDKEKSLLDVRTKALNLKKEYASRVKLRADSQREVNDLLQRKGSWNSADVLRFTELVQQDHENEQAEVRAKVAMEAGDEEAEKGFQDFMQAILERYHEEQVWSDKIRAISTYGSLAITSLNVLLFIITLLLIEPWRRRRLVENVEERLRTNSQQSQEATLAQLVSLQNLFIEAQNKLDHLTSLVDTPSSTNTLRAATIEDSPSSPLEFDPNPESIPFTPLPEPDSEDRKTVRRSKPLEEIRTIDEAWVITKEKLEEHETLAAGIAGAVGAFLIAGLFNLLTR
ncbi:She9p [Sporobolomyces salmoneus]|uniref:She9p n=1 Tax=Sporobolomyces salmoneus TaxID=183962 RepID=UPI00317F8FBA